MDQNEQPLNVLVVDDEESIRLAVERVLKRMGCQVFMAASGEQSLEILGQEQVSLVFLDLKMPGIDGMEVQKRIREIDDSILVIIITGFATIETAIEAMKRGAYDFIPKPFEVDQFRLVAKRALERIQLSREAARLEEEQRRTLFDLSTEKSRTRSIVEALPNGVMVTNSNGQVVLMNDAVKRHLNLDPDCRIGSRVEDYVSHEGLCSFVHDIAGASQSKEEEPSCELSLDEDKHLLVKASPIHGDDQEYLGSVVVFADISPIKKLDKLKSEFVAKVSHELRSPLSTIHEQMALVIQDMLEQEQVDRDQQILSRMQERTRGLIKLVEDLLDLSRLEAGAAYQESQDVSLQDLLPRLVDTLQDQAGEKKQSLDLSMPDDRLPPVHADPNALECVFNNLISNAIKYSPEEGAVHVRLEPAGSYVQVEVQDNGFGIEPEEQERIFERFYRVKNAKTRFVTGSGLGLPIVKGILDDLGGRIAVRSEPGQGSTFTVTLPTVQ